MAVLKYKTKDGEYQTLTNISIKGIEPKQTTGTSTTEVMSQNAVTVALQDKAATSAVTELNGTVTGINQTLTAHTADSTVHVTSQDKATWGDVVNKVAQIDYNTYTAATSGAVSANTAAIAKLNGDVNTSGSVLNTVTTEIAKVVADAPAAFDTLKEISDWIGDNPSGASYMQSEITTNATNINTVSGSVTAHTSNNDIHVTTSDKQTWNAVTAKTDNADFTAHTASSVHMSETEKTNLDSLATNIEAISGIDSTKVSAWDGAASNSHSHDNKTYLDGITGTVGTMIYQNANSYSSATEVNTAFSSLGTAASKGVATGISSGSDNLTPSNVVYNYLTTNYSSATEVNTAISDVYDKLGSGFTSSSVTEVIESNERVTAAALNDLKDNKLDASAYTPTDLSQYWTSAQTTTAINSSVSGKADTANTLGGYGITDAKIENGVITLGSNSITPLTAVSIPVTSVTTSSTNGNISVNGSDVAVHGLGSAAYQNADDLIGSGDVITLIDDKLGSGFTGVNSGRTVTDVIEENEEILSAAYNELNAAFNEISGTVISDAVSIAELSGTVISEAASIAELSGKVGIFSAVSVSANVNNVTCPTAITGASNHGAQATIVYYNAGSSADYTVSISTSSSYKFPDPSASNYATITCKKSGYCEVNYLNINGVIYVRGI